MRCVKIVLFILCCSVFAYGQRAKEGVPKFVTVTHYHWDLDFDNLNLNDWKRGEQEYFDKVTSKNEFLRSSTYYLHRFSNDSSELLLVQTFNSWEDINNAINRNTELEQEAWPDQTKREAFLKQLASYYQVYHSDEIYLILPQIKPTNEYATVDHEMLMYIRRSHFSKTGNGLDADFQKLQKLYLENVFNKNEYIKGYYANVHAWGSDKSEFVEAFYVRSYHDLEQMLKTNIALTEKAWPNVAERNQINKAYSAYFTGIHGDYIYVAVPEFSK